MKDYVGVILIILSIISVINARNKQAGQDDKKFSKTTLDKKSKKIPNVVYQNREFSEKATSAEVMNKKFLNDLLNKKRDTEKKIKELKAKTSDISDPEEAKSLRKKIESEKKALKLLDSRIKALAGSAGDKNNLIKDKLIKGDNSKNTDKRKMEISDSEKLKFSKEGKSLEIIKEEEICQQNELTISTDEIVASKDKSKEFDPRVAMIYSEILNKPLSLRRATK